jgi:hypothetical protein
MCKKFATVDRTDCEIITFEVWQKILFPLCIARQQTLTARGAKNFNYAILGFCTIVMHIILGTCVPNLRGRWWVEHTHMDPALKKGLKNLHYTSNYFATFCDFTFFIKLKSQQWIWGSMYTLILAKIKFENFEKKLIL